MDGFSVRDQQHPRKEITSMSEEQVAQHQRPVGGADGYRWRYQVERDERLFEAAWFAGYRDRFRADLQDARFGVRRLLNASDVALGKQILAARGAR